MGLLRAIINKFRIGSKRAEKVLSNPVEEADLAIEDSQKQVANFRQAITRAMAQNNELVKQRIDAVANSDKYQRIAQMAVKAGNDEDATTALTMKVSFDKRASQLQSEIEKNNDIIKNERGQLGKIVLRVEGAKNNKEILGARFESAKARKELSSVGSNISSGGLSALDNLEKAVNAAEAEAAAYEEIQGTHSVSLEDKYSGDNDAVSSQLAALKNKK